MHALDDRAVMPHSHSTGHANAARANEGLLQAALQRLDRLDPENERWEAELSALSMGVVDALLAGDTAALEAAADPLRDALSSLFEDNGHAREIRGWLLGLLSATRWGAERLPSPDELALSHNTMAWTMLTFLENETRSSADLKLELDTSASQISRTGRDLLARGLVMQRRIGRQALWEIAPRGHQLLNAATHVHRPRHGGDGDRRAPRNAS